MKESCEPPLFRTKSGSRCVKNEKGVNVKEATQIAGLKEEILQLTALSGEISEYALERLNESSGYTDNCLSRLRQERMIVQYKRDDLTGHRLAPKGRHYLVKTYPNRFADLFAVSGAVNKVRLDLLHRRRHMRSSEVLVMMYELGISIFPDEKPKLYEHLTDSSQSSQAVYYTSYEVKDRGEESIKFNNARFSGLLRCTAGDYLVYNTGASVIKWESMSEFRAAETVGHLLKSEIHQLIIGDTIDTAWDLLTSEGGRQHKYFRLDDMIPSILFVPNDVNGDFLVRMNLLSDSMNRLKHSVLQKMNLHPCPNSLDCDGYTDANTAVLFACDMDLKRIHTLKFGLEARGLKSTIICFDFQAELLNRYFGDLATIRTIDAQKTAVLFSIPYRGGTS